MRWNPFQSLSALGAAVTAAVGFDSITLGRYGAGGFLLALSMLNIVLAGVVSQQNAAGERDEGD